MALKIALICSLGLLVTLMVAQGPSLAAAESAYCLNPSLSAAEIFQYYYNNVNPPAGYACNYPASSCQCEYLMSVALEGAIIR